MRKIFFYTIIVTLIASCKNPVEEQRKILHDFDSINKHLQKINSLLDPTDAEYDSLLQIAWNKGGQAQQLNYTLVDFHGYIHNFRSNFYRFTGDRNAEQIPLESEDSIELTNAFFKTEGFGMKGLSAYLQAVLKELRPFTRDSILLSGIDKFNTEVSEEGLKLYFRDAPPVAAVTMLKYFEQKTKEIELDVLRDYFKSH